MLRALYSFIANIGTLLKQPYSRKQKVSVLLTFCKLQLKQLFSFGNSKNVTEHICGFIVHAFDRRTLTFLFQEIFVHGEYFFKTTTNTPTIYDCGSNIGIAILFFKWLYPESVIHAFEPDPDTFALLQKNIAVNKLSSVTLHQTALGNSTGTISFYRNAHQGSLKASVLKERGGENTLEVPLSPLSSYVQGSIDFLKIDTEGAEGSMVQDLVTSNALHQVREMVIEYHHNTGGENLSLSEILSHIEKSGFKYQIHSPFLPLARKNRFQDVMLYCYRNN